MAFLVTCKFDDDRIKTEGFIVSINFHYKSTGFLHGLLENSPHKGK